MNDILNDILRTLDAVDSRLRALEETATNTQESPLELVWIVDRLAGKPIEVDAEGELACGAIFESETQAANWITENRLAACKEYNLYVGCAGWRVDLRTAKVWWVTLDANTPLCRTDWQSKVFPSKTHADTWRTENYLCEILGRHYFKGGTVWTFDEDTLEVRSAEVRSTEQMFELAKFPAYKSSLSAHKACKQFAQSRVGDGWRHAKTHWVRESFHTKDGAMRDLEDAKFGKICWYFECGKFCSINTVEVSQISATYQRSRVFARKQNAVKYGLATTQLMAGQQVLCTIKSVRYQAVVTSVSITGFTTENAAALETSHKLSEWGQTYKIEFPTKL